MTAPNFTQRTRRNFLHDFLWGIYWLGLSTILLPVLNFFTRDSSQGMRTVVGVIEDFPPNSVKLKLVAGEKLCLLITDGGGHISALHAHCSHQACTVRYRPDLQQIECPCHKGRYDLTGLNISGPPRRPLTAFKVTIEDSQVVVEI